MSELLNRIGWHNIFIGFLKNRMSSTNDFNRSSDIPENSSSKPMDSKRDVSQSPDEKTDQDFPGYPHNPAKEDIMEQSTGAHRADADLENMGTGANATGVNQRFLAGQKNEQSQGNEINRDDAEETGQAGRDEKIGLPQNSSNEDLNRNSDLPGSDIEEAAEKGSTNP